MNSLISCIITTFMVVCLLLQISIENSKTFSKYLNNYVEIYTNIFIFTVFYFVFWVLIQKCMIKFLLLCVHNLTIILYITFFLNINYFYILKLIQTQIFVSLVMIIYSAFREKQAYDSFAFNLQKDTIQEDWKNIVNDFPNGVVLLSLKKHIYYLNKSVINLLNLDYDPEMYTSLDRKAVSEKTPEHKIIELQSLYETLVERIGKIEEVNPTKNSYETLNFLDRKPSDSGFSILNSSDFSLKIPLNKKKTLLGINPVNISSDSYPVKRKSPYSNPHMKASFCSQINKVSNEEVSPLNSLPDKSRNGNMKDKSSQMKKVDLSQMELTLDDVIVKLRKRMKSVSRKSEQGENFKCSENFDEINTYCTQYKNFKRSLDKNQKKYELKIKPIFYKNERVFLIIVQDVSYLDLVQELRENNEYKTKVLTTLSHELRTPLNGAIAPLERLMNDKNLLNSPLLKEFDIIKELDIAFKSMMLLHSVLNDVVDFALINSNQLYLNYEEMNFSQFIRETIELFTRQAEQKNVEIELFFDLEKKIPKFFKTDFQRLRQILVSLLNNAIKNTFKGSIKVHVQLEKAPTNVFVNKACYYKHKSLESGKVSSYDRENLNNSGLESKNLLDLDFPLLCENEREIPKQNSVNFIINSSGPSSDKAKRSLTYKENQCFSLNIPKYVIKISIKDTGVGIEQTKLERIRQCLSSRDLLEVCVNLNRKRGCGLGLTISHCLSLLLGPKDCKGLEIYAEHQKGTEVLFFLEGYLEREKEEESLSVIEENRQDSSNLQPNYRKKSINRKRTSVSVDMEIISRVTGMKKYETALNLPMILKKDLMRSESENNLVTPFMLPCSEIDYENPEISDFLLNHCFETHVEAISENNKGNLEKIQGIYDKSDEKIFGTLSKTNGSLQKSNGSIKINSPKNSHFSKNSSPFYEENVYSFQNHSEIIEKGKFRCFCEEILIVDDDSFNILALEAILSKFSLKVVKAFNGQQAIDIIMKKNKEKCGENCCLFPLIFLDYHMPIKDGVETTIEIKEMVKKDIIPEFPIIACTAFGAKNLVESWGVAGMSDLVIKPLNLEKMERILRKWKII